MNFRNLYYKTQNRLKDSVLSLWATGDAAMQQYFSEILNKEKLMAEPVFQTAFPWESTNASFAETNQLFNDDFIKALDAVPLREYRFPSDRKPYKHQFQSWDTLINQNKSIAVTTGTGSGKTECFMLPVLYDIYKNCSTTNGVNAIFLYPLNALIGSQKKRIGAWCKALGGINYAVYNGNTQESAPANDKKNKLPELISRDQIRKTPPQILFTNPSMLEYVLVRNKDVDLLNNSAGTLRWILLDEAHTLKGSSAAEMALLIRRIVDAFKVDVNKLRFAITSATVGTSEGNENRLKTFMANLCGISESSITVITGSRILTPELQNPIESVHNFSDILNSKKPQCFAEVHKLRKDILSKPALSSSEIGNLLKTSDLDQQLQLLDHLSETRIDGHSLLPVRGHFFARGIGGVYVCTNPECEEHKNIKPALALGTMTTIAGSLCKCGSVMLELVACRSCGNQLFEGQIIHNKKTGDDRIQLVAAPLQDPFAIDPQDTDEDDDKPEITKYYFTRNFTSVKYIKEVSYFSISNEGIVTRNNGAFVDAGIGTTCPHCGAETSNPLYFRLSSSFINRVLADVFLEETPEDERQTKEMLWKGHKYISFTDSRQGTAKISALINQDNEAYWIRSHVYHKLCEKKKEWKSQNPDIPEDQLKLRIAQLEKDLLTTTFPSLKNDIIKDIEKYKNLAINPGVRNNSINLDWSSLKQYLNTQTEFKILFDGNNPNDSNPNAKRNYLTAILYDQFARRLPRERSLENLGMVSLIYPKLQDVSIPLVAKSLNITQQEWQSLLKIAADYLIRYSFHFFVEDGIYHYTTRFLRSLIIYNTEAEEINAGRWPKLEHNTIRKNRLALLICAGLGFQEREDITQEIEDNINELLEVIWRTLKNRILRTDGGGYKLSLEETTLFELSENLWLCPVTKRLIDTQFKGYSPWIKGNLTSDNIRHYKIEQSVRFPDFLYPFNLDEEKNLNLEPTRQWMRENTIELRKQGVWNNLHEQVILNRPLYLSGEHSAQQNETRLKDLEDKFERAEINILNCSTTMEMGVDIGGISAVVMNNVPPSPANYLQRAGRAGRRGEAKSLAFTICSSSPIGLHTMDDPMWALNHSIAPPFLSFKSEIVVERHVNAFFLGKFVQTDPIKGLNVKITTDRFFFNMEQPIAEMFNNWLLGNDSKNHKTTLEKITKNTPLEDKTFSYLLNKVILNFQKLANKTDEKKRGLEEKLKLLAAEFGAESPAYKAVLFQKIQLLDKNAIAYLAGEGFLPTAGLPTGIVEFDTVNIDDLSKKNTNKAKPSYFITRALSEFAPGNQIIIDGKSYTSEGIILQNDWGTQAEREIIQSCANCGYQRIIEVAKNEDINSECPHCHHTTFKGISFKDADLQNNTFTEMIQPAGFAVDIYEHPSRKISAASGAQYVDPLLINIRPWESFNTALFDARESEDYAEILFYNIGRGNGYSVCLHCGRTATEKANLGTHKRLRGGKNNDKNAICSGNNASYAVRENVILGGRFKTDFCEIRFKDEHNRWSNDNTLLYTLGAVLSKELSHFLAVEENEISFGIKHYDQYSTIFIFDTAKGGAGYSSQFTLYADKLFKIATRKLSQCDCDKACTKCLIDRQTQWHIDKLDRHQALEWLNKATSVTVPPEYSNLYPTLKVAIGGIKEEIHRLSYANKITEIWMYGAANISEWALEEMPFIKKLRDKINFNFVLDDADAGFNTQDKISLIQSPAWPNILKKTSSDNQLLKTICFIQTTDGEVLEYLTENFERTFNQHWGNSNSGFIYKNSFGVLQDFDRQNILIDEQSVFEVRLDENNPIQSNEIVDLLLSKLEGKIDLKGLMNNQSFKVEYYDRYLKTPFGCILMTQFINRLGELLSFEIDSFNFKGQEFKEDRQPKYLYHSFNNSDVRNESVIELAEQLKISNISAANEYLPHYRYFEFTSKNIKVIIRPDAGIEHGWFCAGDNRSEEILFTEPLDASNKIKILKNTRNDILYTVSIEKLFLEK